MYPHLPKALYLGRYKDAQKWTRTHNLTKENTMLFSDI